VLAADKVTPEAIAFMANYGRGLICLTLTEEQIARLELPMMAAPGRSGRASAPRYGQHRSQPRRHDRHQRGRSRAHDSRRDQPRRKNRATSWCRVTSSRWSRVTAASWCAPVKPKARLIWARLAGSSAAGIVCEIANDDGTMARMPDLERFAEKHGLVILTIADLIAYRLQTEALVSLVAETPVELESHAHHLARVRLRSRPRRQTVLGAGEG